MSEESIRQLAEHKLIILHLLQKMGIALSNSEICQFLLEKNYMDYFSIQQYLTELVDAGWLENHGSRTTHAIPSLTKATKSSITF